MSFSCSQSNIVRYINPFGCMARVSTKLSGLTGLMMRLGGDELLHGFLFCFMVFILCFASLLPSHLLGGGTDWICQA